MSSSSFCKLACVAQRYAWGKRRGASLVAHLAGQSNSSSGSEEDRFAELWMGTHPSGPSAVAGAGGSSLKDWLQAHEGFVGRVPAGYTNDDLPFLFKVLSIETALSIQSHPDKALAKQLFEQFPQIYKDPNHKPEMAIALTPFEALCGFLSVSQICDNLKNYPELVALVGPENVQLLQDAVSDAEKARSAIKSAFRAFMTASAADCSAQIDTLVARLNSNSDSNNSQLDALILRLNQQYPNDRGIFCALLLNYLRLTDGQSFFIGANEPHAYISGDCIECMALSDNVVRAGLTPKFCDVETLCKMLHYRSGAPELLTPSLIDRNTELYRPPADVCAEFEVERTTVVSNSSYDILPAPCASILIVTFGGENATISDKSGRSEALAVGDVICLGAGESVKIDNQGDVAICLYRAHANLNGI